MAREQLKTLTEPMYYILLSLLKENHGYGIMQLVDELTEGRVVIGAGTLYSLLGRFEREEIIVQVAEENRRKIYKITEKGAGLLQEEYERLNHLVEDGKKFFSFEGARKDPPEDNGGGQEKEEEVKIEESNGTEAAGVGETRDSETVREKRETQRIPRGGWNYGGAF